MTPARRQICRESLAALLLYLTGRHAAGEGSGRPDAVADHPKLVAAMRALLGSLRRAELDTFLRDWPKNDAGVRPGPAAALPALRWLPSILAQAPAAAAALTGELEASARSLRWRQTYPADRVSPEFLDNYAWTELLGLSGEVPSPQLLAGFLILGPHTDYPRHAHEAEEIYVPLSGTAGWWKTSAGWRERLPLEIVHHAPNEAHAMRTAEQPLLALYLWHGAGLERKAHLVAD
jgi:quercetin dioxygenase-like cupin family protein